MRNAKSKLGYLVVAGTLIALEPTAFAQDADVVDAASDANDGAVPVPPLEEDETDGGGEADGGQGEGEEEEDESPIVQGESGNQCGTAPGDHGHPGAFFLLGGAALGALVCHRRTRTRGRG